MENKDTGLLLNKKNIEINRFYFKQALRLYGINVLYRVPRKEYKQYDLHGELDAKYEQPRIVPCIFNEHADQKTMKKLGWNSERTETTPIIHVQYDLEGLESGCLFEIPAGLDNAQARVFKVLDLSNIPVYPASITCKLGPVLKSEFERPQLENFENTDFNLLESEEEE